MDLRTVDPCVFETFKARHTLLDSGLNRARASDTTVVRSLLKQSKPPLELRAKNTV